MGPSRSGVRVPDANAVRDLLPAGTKLYVGGALDIETVAEGCNDAAVVYDCVLLPLGEWTDAFPVVTSDLVAVARRTNATVVQPSLAFGYGPLRESPPPRTTRDTPPGRSDGFATE